MNWKRTTGFFLLFSLCFGCITGCGADGEITALRQPDLVVYSPHPLDLINPIVSEFEARTGIVVRVHNDGTGKLLKMVEEKQEPLCDVVWGGSLSIVLPKQELFEDYTSANELMIPVEFQNQEGNLTRFTDMPSVLMVNLNLIGDIPIEGYQDLLRPELRGRIAMCDPAVSSSAQEQLINMLYAMGEGDPEAGWDYVEQFCRNLDGKLLKSSSAVYQGVAEGRYAVGLTFEQGAANYVVAGRAVKMVYMKEGVLSTPDIVGIAKGAPHPEAARAFVDFVTSRDAQTVMASGLGRRPVRVDVREPAYLADKRELKMIYDDREVVTRQTPLWISRFGEIFQSTLPQAADQ